ncbi:MAG: response regulator [Caulobacteraceae bacterium]|nr:response regulator [Caulobacteraceae bacterium]
MNDESSILLIEDNPDDAELVRYAFEKVGIGNPLVSLSDGDSAVEFLGEVRVYADRKRHPLPALILLDLKLPRRSGFEVLRFIRDQEPTRHIPVVVLTSSNQQDDIKRAYEDGANSYLVKPVSRDALIEMVRSLDAYWIKLNQVDAR